MPNRTTALAKVLLTAIILVAVPVVGLAHNLWINAIDYSPEFTERTGASTKVYFGFGHKYPVHDFLDKKRLTEFKLIEPGGAGRDLEPGEDGLLMTPVRVKKEGAYVISAATKTGFYTMHMKEGRLKHKLGSMEGLNDVVLSLYYENYTKAILNVGQTADDAYSKPVGHNIEIVPMENPYLKRAGDTLKLKVLHRGKPVPFCPVFATYVGFSAHEDYAFANKTNSKGISTIRLLQPGHWIVKAVIRKPAKEDLKEKCIEEKYSATISFGVE